MPAPKTSPVSGHLTTSVRVADVVAMVGSPGLRLSFRDHWLPAVTTSTAKGIFPERHPLALGAHLGAVSPSHIVDAVALAEQL